MNGSVSDLLYHNQMLGSLNAAVTHWTFFFGLLPLVFLVSSTVFILCQDCLLLDARVKQADVRNRQLSNQGAAFRYRLSGLLTAGFIVAFHLLVLLWLYYDWIPGLKAQILNVFLTLLSLVLYHNSRYMHRKCLLAFRASLILCYLSRAGLSVYSLYYKTSRSRLLPVLNVCLCLVVALVVYVSRDILDDQLVRAFSNPLAAPLLESETIRSTPAFQMGNPFGHRLLSRTAFLFVGKLIQRAGNFTNVRNMPDLGKEETSQFNVDNYESLQSPSFLWKVLLFMAPVLSMSGFLELFQSCLNFMQPLIINRLLVHLEGVQNEELMLGENPTFSSHRFKSIVCVLLLGTSACSITFFITMYFNMQFRLAIRLRSLLICLIYRKVMKLPLKARRKETNRDAVSGGDAPQSGSVAESPDEQLTSGGQVVNMISSDVARVEWASMALHNCWSAVLQLALPIYLLYCQVGWPAFTVLLVMVTGVPLANLVFKFQLRNAGEIMKWKDQRLAVSREVFSNIKCVKLFAWEGELKKRIADLRERELTNLWRMRVGEFLNNTLWNGLPIVMSLSVFGCCAVAAVDRDLSVQQLLTAFAIINMIAFPLSFLPLVTAALSEGITTLWRLKAFLALPEMNTSNRLYVKTTQASPYSIVCENLEFRWSRDDVSSVWRDVSFKVRNGVHLAIVGPTGSGKTTLVETLIGNLNPSSGQLSVYGRLAYCSQSAWLQAGTLRSNILFGSVYHQERYTAACEAAALSVDFAELSDGDLTKVGDRGCTLSGGQRHRVALARALYRDADVYIFDDVLSAVDHKVARQICAEVFGKFLKSKTVILVTHRSEALQFMDYVLCLGAEGTASLYSASDRTNLPEWFESGAGAPAAQPPATPHTHTHLDVYTVPRIVPASPAAHLPSVEPPRQESEGDTPRSLGKRKFGAEAASPSPHQMEQVDVHQIPWQTYSEYFQGCGGLASVLLLCVMAASSQGFAVFSNWFLSFWANHWKSMDAAARLEALSVFCASNAFALSLLAGGSLLAAFLAQRASRIFHWQLVQSLLNATLTFIEGTPQGSILNRLSQDIQILDERLPQNLMSVMQETLKVAGILFITIAVIPISLFLIAPVIWVYRKLLNQFVTLARQMQRLDASLRSPLVAIFSESVEGIATIRAFGVASNFILDQQRRLDNHLKASYLTLLMNRWLAIKLELMGALITCVVGLLCIWRVNTLSVATIGLAMSYCMMLSGALAWLVRIHGDKENNIVSVDRLGKYIDCPQEEAFDDDPVFDDIGLHWPPAGAIQFQRVSVRYLETGERALQEVSLNVKPGQKVAVLGRTGAGKSTLLNCLFRLVPFEGRVFIDGVDICNLSLRSLRSSLAVIPQDPITLSGTIRDNLDPFRQCHDNDILEALDLVQLRTIVDSLPERMYTSLSDGKFEFSAGQKQLLCLARVLLKETRVLVLDEATSSVDPATDALVQQLIRTHFTQCTVLTIAHRISTVLDYDMVVGMEAGRIVETGNPQELLLDRDSLLSSLYRASQQQTASSESAAA